MTSFVSMIRLCCSVFSLYVKITRRRTNQNLKQRRKNYNRFQIKKKSQQNEENPWSVWVCFVCCALVKCIDSFSTSEINMHLEHWTLNIESNSFLSSILPMNPFGPLRGHLKPINIRNGWISAINTWESFNLNLISHSSLIFIFHGIMASWLVDWLIGWPNVIKSCSLRFRSPFSRNNDYDWAVNILNIVSCRLALIISTRKFIKASKIIQNWVEPAAIYKPFCIF